MFERDELLNWLVKIGMRVNSTVSIYMIGGGALSFKNIKPSTKDIDIIVKSKADFDILDKAIKEEGFELLTDIEDEFYITALAVFVKEESRIDIFLNQVGKMLFLSPSMIKRAQEFRQFGKLNILLISNEDIFLFKSMTPRQGDIDDCDRLIKEGLDYDVMYEEIMEQSKKENKWFFWMFEKICKIEEFNNTRIPIKNKLYELITQHWEQRPSDFMSQIDNLEEHIPDSKLRKEINNN